ncbi:hypothetical protein [Stenotrophomonas maltophilia]|uniref:hypothetical protein n=1 Tax=Stenotrophomonas maltophilia TaxID=40324 RepID=UPI00144156D1|nr:hypothetical protein [Stenotrophomonas maltophilia]
MRLFHVHIPGVAGPHSVIAEAEQAAIDDALYTLGLSELPEGSSFTSEQTGDT